MSGLVEMEIRQTAADAWREWDAEQKQILMEGEDGEDVDVDVSNACVSAVQEAAARGLDWVDGQSCENGCHGEGRWAGQPGWVCDACVHRYEGWLEELREWSKLDGFDPAFIVWPLGFKRTMLVAPYHRLTDALHRRCSIEQMISMGVAVQVSRWQCVVSWVKGVGIMLMRWVCRD